MGRASRGARLAGAVALLFSLVTVAASRGSAGAAPDAATAPPTRATASAAGITFGRPTVSGIQGIGYEEDVRRDDTDPAHPIIYTSVPGSLASGTSWIWRSLDNGSTFKWVPAATPKAGKVDTTCPGGGDTELAVDTAGHLYFNDLTLTNFSTARSDDHGATFAPVSCAGVNTTPD